MLTSAWSLANISFPPLSMCPTTKYMWSMCLMRTLVLMIDMFFFSLHVLCGWLRAFSVYGPLWIKHFHMSFWVFQLIHRTSPLKTLNDWIDITKFQWNIFLRQHELKSHFVFCTRSPMHLRSNSLSLIRWILTLPLCAPIKRTFYKIYVILIHVGIHHSWHLNHVFTYSYVLNFL
jgi:hypothetical protein